MDSCNILKFVAVVVNLSLIHKCRSMSTLLPNQVCALQNKSVRVVGICGGIGSGKSTASKLLVTSCNCLKHIDADYVAHSIYSPGSQVCRDVIRAFGDSIVLRRNDKIDTSDDQIEIDRKKLGEIVFSDQSSMRQLEKIVWPHVRAAIINEINTIRSRWEVEPDLRNSENRPIVVLEAAILVDAGWDQDCDGVWVVSTSKQAALARLIESRGLTEIEALKRIKFQEKKTGNWKHRRGIEEWSNYM